ncbi:MAG: Gfo/Idh/MocA family oxidoreductase [Firmicutes bacterium]|nr:Gfo/Idh/MocA family oxidoreductase [Bacillota bacterium]
MKWGILGVNWIADYLAASVKKTPGAEIAAAASRTKAKTDAFAARHGAAGRWSSCEELARDPNVEAVYIATPHSFHFEHSMICMERGKHVLCEKPFAVSRAEGEAMFREADRRGVFIMEAMWTRFLPSAAKMREVIAAGKIGEVRYLELFAGGDIGPQDPAGRMLNPALAGGAVLDVGVYALTVGQILTGAHESLRAQVIRGATGVDTRSAVCVKYSSGALASVAASIDTNVGYGRRNAVYGSEGVLRFECIWSPAEFTVEKYGRPEDADRYGYEADARAYGYEIEAFEDCVKKGLREPERGKRADTLEILGMTDEILGR